MNFDKTDKFLFFAFLIFGGVDIASCFIEGNSFSRYFRPSGWLFFTILTLKYFQNEVKYYLLLVSILSCSVADYFYYSYGEKALDKIVWLLIIKDVSFFVIFMSAIKNKIIFNLKFFAWLAIHTGLGCIFWAILDVKHSLNGFILSLLVFYILLVISLNRSENYIFRQSYLGTALVLMSVIFASIRLNDDTPIVELLDRVAHLSGYFLIFCGILKIRVLKN